MTIGAAIVNHDVFWEGYEILQNATLNLTTFRSSYVKGMIQCDRDGLLYASIPQNGNWEVKVDGKPAEIHLVGDCMVAVEITEGQHLVKYTYHNAAFALAWKISLACGLMLLAMVQLVYKPDWKAMLKKLPKLKK